MSTMDRRRALKLIGAAGVAPLAGFDWTPEEVVRSASQLLARQAAAPATTFAPDFFNPHEWETVRLLVDLVIPADERSPAATAAGVPEFMDFMMVDGPEARRTAMREGLTWLDAEAERRHGATFLAASDVQRRDVLDDVAWPERAQAALQSGVNWFNSFRDLTGAGFFSSRIGYQDLQYMGNVHVGTWNGCPDAALRKVGLTYDVMNTRR